MAAAHRDAAPGRAAAATGLGSCGQFVSVRKTGEESLNPFTMQ
jgi:hypothetical protein